MAESRPIIFIVDDDASVREAIGNLLDLVGLQAHAFASAEEFLGVDRPDVPSCLVLDVQAPGTKRLGISE